VSGAYSQDFTLGHTSWAPRGHRGSQDFLRGALFFLKKVDDLFSRRPQNTGRQRRWLFFTVKIKQIKQSDMVTFLIFCSHCYRSKAMAEPGRWSLRGSPWCSAATGSDVVKGFAMTLMYIQASCLLKNLLLFVEHLAKTNWQHLCSDRLEVEAVSITILTHYRWPVYTVHTLWSRVLPTSSLPPPLQSSYVFLFSEK